jgi:hypothetical protein
MKKKVKTNKNNIKHVKNKTRKFVNLKCSPKPVGTIQNKNSNEVHTCYSSENLLQLKNMWNSKNPDNLIITNDPDMIWVELKNKLSNVCDRESCWYKQFMEKHHLNKALKDLFAPESPSEWKKNPTEWLSSIDILDVMNQYVKIYKCFEFIGPTPIDFDAMETKKECVWDELCRFSLEDQIRRGKTKIGVIFNTDPHNKSGEHWISLFINIKKGFIYFFDSAGDKIPNRINKFVKRVIQQGKKLPTPIIFKFDQNYPKEHQYGESECGMYSLFFIVHMLEDKVTGEYLKTHVLNDKYITRFRKIYFNDEL